MSTSIFLGNPPENIKQFIIDNYSKPVDMTKVPLTFTAEEPNATFSLKSSNGPDVTLETSTTGEDGSWQPYNVGDEIILENIGDKIMFRNSSDEIQVMGTAYNKYNYFKINTGKIAASGNIMFLMDKTGELRDLSGKENCYYSMFRDCTSLTQAPTLPATALANYCYNNMFYNCTSLTQAPELPATTLANYCYESMFYGCTSLTQAPELPAETLASNCYNATFSDCTSLTQAPVLPATTLADSCYYQMFKNCTSLTQAPELPAETLNSSCYNQMFDGCTDLIKPEFKMSNLKFDEVATAIQNDYIIGGDYEYYETEPTFTYEIQCSDKTMIAIPTYEYYEGAGYYVMGWTLEEKT